MEDFIEVHPKTGGFLLVALVQSQMAGRTKTQLEKDLNLMCMNKHQFDSKEDASRRGQEVYECPACGKWHTANRRRYKR